MTNEDATLDSEDLTPEARWSYYVTAYSMRDPTEGVSYSDMRMPFLKRNLPNKLDEDEEYDRFYRRLQHHDGLIIRICANNYTILYQPPSHDWFWRSTVPILDKDADAEAIKAKEEEQTKEKAATREKRHDRFVEKFVNNPNWARGLSKDKVDESNQRFRSWLNGTLEKEDSVPAETAEPVAAVAAPAVASASAADSQSEVQQTTEQPDTDMADAEPAAAAEA
jgi:paired amphipathic helix protein Sin3a